MKVLYEGIGNPCDLCMYEPGSVACNEAGACAELVMDSDRIDFYNSEYYYFTEDQEQGMTDKEVISKISLELESYEGRELSEGELYLQGELEDQLSYFINKE